jgi:proliferating cell nuclear antigen
MKRIFEIKTVQTGPLRCLFEALKDILEDVNIEIRAPTKGKENDEEIGGIRIIALSSSRNILVRLKLHASKFDNFICNVPRKVISVSMQNLHILLKSGNNNDVITLYQDDTDLNHLGIKFENHEKNYVRTFNLTLLDLDEDPVNIPPLQYTSLITMPSNDFSKICRDMSNLSDEIEITSVNDTIKFSCKGDFASDNTVYGKSKDGVNVNRTKDSNDIIQGVYDLKNILLFTKCTNLCNNIEIYFQNNFPLTIVYSVGDLGTLRFCLSEKVRDDVEDVDEILNEDKEEDDD